jgi:hypothetical protein
MSNEEKVELTWPWLPSSAQGYTCADLHAARHGRHLIAHGEDRHVVNASPRHTQRHGLDDAARPCRACVGALQAIVARPTPSSRQRRSLHRKCRHSHAWWRRHPSSSSTGRDPRLPTGAGARRPCHGAARHAPRRGLDHPRCREGGRSAEHDPDGSVGVVPSRVHRHLWSAAAPAGGP